ncbi:histidine kinase [Pseudoalteromonas luteoviolacea]|uniref:histidine kinase n=1 Tax=Pseudoalteromonas luteoviolacea TaxID=43657 RepID=A0A1C0TLE3_9GAMM|nr:ATP-binding protein [Pseudoalteromonas luteoviolacea]MBQ4812741.1 response regulator [Pseudoalteromonas luteoviolacea]OCQ19177.1 histidine kinase [Pseudoalteromonas luteoviolacea]
MQVQFRSPIYNIAAYVLLTLGYFGFGKLFTLFAFQNQVLPIWLPAGIALVGCFLWGWRFAPAIFCASVLFNWTTYFGFQSPLHHYSDILQVVIVAIGAVLQGLIGGYLMRLWLGDPLLMRSRKYIAYYVLLIGIGVNLVSANIGMLSLSLFNPQYAFSQHWQNVIAWWLGDSLGILIFTPLLLMLLNISVFAKRPYQHKRIMLATCAILFMSVTATTYLYNLGNLNAAQREAQREINIIENLVLRHVNLSMLAVQGMAAKLQSLPEFDLTQFNQIAEQQRQRYSFLFALSWGQRSPQSHAPQLQAELNQLYRNEVKIQGTPLSPNDPLVVVKYVSPQAENFTSLGFNIYSRANRKLALEDPEIILQPRATNIVKLIQTTPAKSAYVLFSPVFEQSIQQQGSHADITGYAIGVVQTDVLLNSVLKTTHANHYDLAFYDGNRDTPFYSNHDATERPYNANTHYSTQIHFAGQTWRLTLAIKDSYISELNHQQTVWLLTLQLSICALITFIVLLYNYQNNALNHLVAQRTESLNLALQDAQQANQAKSRFLANMSHEIRTPLNAVIGFASLTRTTESLSVLQGYVSNINMAAKTLLGLVNDILDITKIESNKLQIEHHSFNLQALLKRLDSLFAASASEKGLSWKLHTNVEHALWLKGDELRVEQILINLCSNAVKFTESGQVSLHCEISESAADYRVQFTVADTGIGIAATQLQDIFAPFSQADSSTSRRYGGTGLGLAICKELSDLMSGNLTVESTPNVGSQFCFSLRCPFGDASNEQTQQYDLALISKLNILVAEDNPVNQIVIKSMLESFGVTYQLVTNGQQAIAQLQKGAFDLVLMDCQMPVLDGYQATSTLRQTYDQSTLPIVALTADVMPEDKAYAIAIGFNSHLAKPLDRDKLGTCLDHYAKLCSKNSSD